MGLGEAPLLRQCTFSIWKNTASMVAYAQSGAHLAAIQAAYKHGFFTESMFVRMRVLSMAGAWQGHDFTAKNPSLAEEGVHA
jgi:spheroidene monooxygenase